MERPLGADDVHRPVCDDGRRLGRRVERDPPDLPSPFVESDEVPVDDEDEAVGDGDRPE